MINLSIITAAKPSFEETDIEQDDLKYEVDLTQYASKSSS